jgi:hypothetical protein
MYSGKIAVPLGEGAIRKNNNNLLKLVAQQLKSCKFDNNNTWTLFSLLS